MRILSELEIPVMDHSSVQAASAGSVKIYINQGVLYTKDEQGNESNAGTNTSPPDTNIDGGTFN